MAELVERIEQERIDGSMEEETGCEGKPTPLLGGIPRQRPGDTDDAEMTERLGKSPGIVALVQFGQGRAVKGIRYQWSFAWARGSCCGSGMGATSIT